MFGIKKDGSHKKETRVEKEFDAGCKEIAEKLKANPEVMKDREAVRAIVFESELPLLRKNTLMIGYDAKLYEFMDDKTSIEGDMFFMMRKRMKRDFGLIDSCADWCVDMWSNIYAGVVLGLPIEDYIYTEDFRLRMREKVENRH